MVSKKLKYDTAAAAALEWLNKGSKDTKCEASRSTTTRHNKEWANLSTFSLSDKKAVTKAKKDIESFRKKYSKASTQLKDYSNKCEYSEVENLVLLLETLESQVSAIKEQIHNQKSKLKSEISEYEHYVFYNLDYKKILHDVAYNTRQTEALVNTMTQAYVQIDCDNISRSDYMKPNRLNHSYSMEMRSDSFTSIYLSADRVSLSSERDIENYVSHLPFFNQSKSY
ncbi:hypothetical protein [Vibrio cholerae]|uniref:hypothetical protein n=1 Tax=Vibrio cholerae TaxID=666 RepID=UPI001E5720E4|nr:hypothetical protein [Vibrio cholerae]MCD6731792.1 hypothetical protein [Vibrio cholerae]